jgi:hypothetical protein
MLQPPPPGQRAVPKAVRYSDLTVGMWRKNDENIYVSTGVVPCDYVAAIRSGFFDFLATPHFLSMHQHMYVVRGMGRDLHISQSQLVL